MNQKERMLAGLPYKGWLDGLSEERLACKKKVYALNQLPPERRGEIPALLKSLFGKPAKILWWSLPSTATMDGILRWEKIFSPITT